MSKTKQIAVLIALVVLVTAFIFSNSMRNSVQSNEASDKVLGILAFVTDFFDKLFGEADWNYIIRKGAHLTEFGALGILVSALVFKVKVHFEKHLMGYGLFYVLLVAVTDEFIQSFSDRTSSVKDVFIDFAGALLGIIIITLISSRRKSAKSNVIS